MRSLIIVSNRLPISVKKVDGVLEFKPSDGGLARGLASYTNNKRNKWIGWPGIPSEEITEEEKRQIADRLAQNNCYPVFLNKKQIDEFYSGYSNSVLWPLMHNLSFKHDHDPAEWRTYQAVNRLFAETILALTAPKSAIWVHDYLLMLVPKMLRAERPNDRIGFFMHIPFPDVHTLKTLPERRSLLRGLMGADLIGFHTHKYTENFLDACQSLTDSVVSGDEIIIGNRVVRVRNFPISIDYQQFAKAAESKQILKKARQYRKPYKGRKIILTVDRLDPTKGLVQRLKGYREFLRLNPRFFGKVVMVMLAVPSRGEIAEYKKLKRDVERLIEEINSTFGTRKWQPIDYMYKSVPFEDVTALYRIADVAFITPLKDGMNLVAKEYIASQTRKSGVLILSETAGAAEELTNAIIVNPNRPSELAQALTQALSMPKLELRKRLLTMQEYLSVHTVQNWVGSFMDSLVLPGSQPVRTRTLKGHFRRNLIGNFSDAKERKIILDYDGVLAPFEGDPSLSKPTKKVYELLKNLSQVEGTQVAIISGRSKADLEKWLGDLPLTLVAEHGAVSRIQGRSWRKTGTDITAWKKIIRLVMEKYAKKTPGAFIEEKEFSLVWHFRKSNPYFAQKYAVVVKRVLRDVLKYSGLEVYSGNKIIEVKSPLANKGTAALKWLGEKADFILAIGDDYTDEDMFTSLPAGAFTVKVGPGKSQAKFRLKSPGEVIELLNNLTTAL